MRVSRHLPLISIAALVSMTPLHAQRPPAIHGVTGTIASAATIKDEHKAAHKIVVVTEDGVEHVYDAAKDLVVHGGTKALADLKPGTTVVIHYSASASGDIAHEIDRVGAGGLSVTEGMVRKIDRGKKEITIRYDNGAVEKLELTDRSAVNAARDFSNDAIGDTRVVVYYSEEAGRRVAHYFKRKS